MIEPGALEVLLYGERIGVLARLGGERTLFSFDGSYVQDPHRPVLGLGFRDPYGDLITEFRATRTRLSPFFSNLLPEGPLRTYLARRAGVKEVREFFLLWVLGQDLPGAITVRPMQGGLLRAEDIEREASEGGPGTHARDALRFSLAGVQLKFSAIREPAGGLTVPAKGVGGSWIVKLPSKHFTKVPENEYSMMTLAKRVGIDVPAIHLVDVRSVGNLPEEIDTVEGKALAIERFDRLPEGEVVHIEDFAQVFDVYPEHKYRKASARNIAQVIAAEGSETDVREFVRRLTFNTLIGNADMHLKNWSLIYPDRVHPALAPAYDFVSTIAFIAEEKAALNFSRTKRFDQFTMDELAHLAGKARIPTKLAVDTAAETVASFRDHWQAEKRNLPLSGDSVKAIQHHLETLPIWR